LDGESAHILVPEVFEQLELSIRPLAQDGSGEGLHNFLDGD